MSRTCHNLLPTKENLFGRKIIQDYTCPICGFEKETTYHVLWGCVAAKDVWGASAKIFQKSNFHSSEFLQVAEHIFTERDGSDLELFVITARRLWFRRNAWVEAFSHPNAVVQEAKRAVETIQLLNKKDEKSTPVFVGEVAETVGGMGENEL
jgi:hypothetical protein